MLTPPPFRSDGPLFAFSLFTPTIINQVQFILSSAPTLQFIIYLPLPQLGFQATAANLLSVPVYAWACIVTVFIGFLGDRIGHRGYINM